MLPRAGAGPQQKPETARGKKAAVTVGVKQGGGREQRGGGM